MLTIQSNTIEAELRQLISTSVVGGRLPSVRELTRRHRASPVTVAKVIARLESEGLLDARPGHGTFVASRPEHSAADVGWQTVVLGSRPIPGEVLTDLQSAVPVGVISLANGYPDASLQALTQLSTATARAARRPEVWGRSPIQGNPALRAWFASDVGGGIRPDDVLIASGGQSAVSAIFRSLASPGDPIIVESPTYVGAIEAARFAGLRPIPVPTDADGIRSDLLEAALKSSGAKLIFLQPLFANPTASVLSAERRVAVLEAARLANAFIVEDDFARDLAFDGRPPRSLASEDVDGHVIHIRSLTKSAAAGLRIAGITARGPALQRLRNARVVDDFFVSGLLQEAALNLLVAPGWQRHLHHLRRSLAERMTAAVDAAARIDGAEIDVRPRGGLLLWLRLDDGVDDLAIVRAARDDGVMISAGRSWFAAEPSGAFLRISIAAASPAQIISGMKILGRLIDAQ